MIPIGSWRPDIAESNGSVARRACNVLLSKDENGLAHSPMPGLAIAAAAEPLPGLPKGAISVVDSVGNYTVVVGTPAGLHRLHADYTWSLLGSSYALPVGDVWSFARFGNNLHMSNRADGMLQFDVDVVGPITAVIGAPKARFLFPAFNAMFALDCDGDNKLMRNSAIGNATIWKDKGSGTQSFPDGEELICGAELTTDFAVVWQTNAIRGLYRRVDGKLYDVKLLYTGRGCVNASAMATIDGRAFFVDTDGFYMIAADGSLTPIGKDRVSKTFIKGLSGDGLKTVEAAVDKNNSRIVFRYRAKSVTSSTVFENAIAYDYELGEWTEIEARTAALVTMAAPAVNLEAMGTLYGPLDGIDIPLDSRVFSGHEPRLGAMDENMRFGFFDGFPLAAVSETGSKIAMQRGTIKSITPITDAANAVIQVGVRERLADNIAWKDGVAIQASGRAPIYASGKIMTFRQTVPAGEEWTTLRGFDGFEVTSRGRG